MKRLSKKHCNCVITERKAIELAARYDLVEEYKFCRRKGMSVYQALEEWDLLTYYKPTPDAD